MRAVLASAVALAEADVLAARRSLGAGPGARRLSAAISALLGALVACAAAAVGATVAAWTAAGGAQAAAAAGAVDLALAALLAAAVLAPLLGGVPARLRGLATACGAPVRGASALLASGARSAAAAPLGPALLVALSAALGHVAWRGAGAMVHAGVVVLALALLGFAAGAWLESWSARRSRPGLARPVAAGLVTLVLGVLAGGGLASWRGDAVSLLAGVHAARAQAALAPSGWAAAALDPGGAAAWWAPALLAALGAFVAVLVARDARPVESSRGCSRAPRPSRVADVVRGPCGVLYAKDLLLLRREPAAGAAALRYAVPALLPALAVMSLALSARGDAAQTARAAGWLPALGWIADLGVIGLSGVVMLLLGLDGGGAAQIRAAPVRPAVLLRARALAWVTFAAPALVAATVLLVVAFGSVVGARAGDVLVAAGRAALEAASAVHAGAGAGLLAAVLRPLPPAARGGAAGRVASGPGGFLAGGLGALLTCAAVAPVALLFHGMASPAGALLGALAGPVIGTLALLAAARLLRAPGEVAARVLALRD